MGSPSLPGRFYLPLFLLLAGLTLALTFPLVLHLDDSVPSDRRDPMYAMWVMSWNVRAVASPLSGFADGNIFYPHKGTLFYMDVLPALSALGAPVLLAGGSPILTYNLLFLLSFVVCGLGMAALVRELTTSRPAAVLAAVAFAFFPYKFAHLSHLELLSCGWMPFVFLFIHRFFKNYSLRNVLGIAVFFVLQVTSCAYYGEFLALFAGLMAAYYAFDSKAWRSVRFWSRAGILAALCAAPLLPYFFAFLNVHKKMLFGRPLWEVKFYSAELQHFLAVPPFNIAWGWLTGRLGAQEWQLFPGLVAIVLTWIWFRETGRYSEAAGAPGFARGFTSVAKTRPLAASVPGFPGERKPRRFLVWDLANALILVVLIILGISGGFKATLAGLKISARSLQNPVSILILSLGARLALDSRVRLRIRDFLRTASPAEKYFLSVAALAWIFSFGPVVRCLGREISAGPYVFLYNWVPGFQNLRVPSRFAVMMMLGLSVLGGCGARLLLDRIRSPRTKIMIAAGIGALIVLEYAAVPIPLAMVPTGGHIPDIYTAVKALPADAVLVELPMPERDRDEDLEADAVYFSIYHRKRIVNGYSGYSPPGYRVIREAMDGFPNEETLALVRDLGVGYVVIHTQGLRPEKGQAMLQALRDYGDRVEPVAQAQADFLFRFRLSAKEAVPEEGLREAGDRRMWKATASLNPKLAGQAFDGDLTTGWSTGYPQRAGDFFKLDLGESTTVRKIELYLNTNPLDFPRSFKVESSLDGGTWSSIYEKTGFFPALNRTMIEDFSKYVVPIPVGRAEVRFLRITLLLPHEERHWSINEIVLKK